MRTEWKQLRHEHRRLLVLTIGFATVAIALVVAVSAWIGAPPFVLGLLVGMWSGVVPLYVFLIKVATGIAAREFGADAERWTAAELDKLDVERWRVFHDVPVPWGNVDHVAIGPGRVYAIETKWTTARGRFRERFAQQAARQAQQLTQALSKHGVDRTVIPLLVIWGTGVADALGHKPEMDHPSQTRVVAGSTAADWLARMNNAADQPDVDWAAIQALQTIVDEAEQGPVAST